MSFDQGFVSGEFAGGFETQQGCLGNEEKFWGSSGGDQRLRMLQLLLSIQSSLQQTSSFVLLRPHSSSKRKRKWEVWGGKMLNVNGEGRQLSGQ